MLFTVARESVKISLILLRLWWRSWWDAFARFRPIELQWLRVAAIYAAWVADITLRWASCDSDNVLFLDRNSQHEWVCSVKTIVNIKGNSYSHSDSPCSPTLWLCQKCVLTNVNLWSKYRPDVWKRSRGTYLMLTNERKLQINRSVNSLFYSAELRSKNTLAQH